MHRMGMSMRIRLMAALPLLFLSPPVMAAKDDSGAKQKAAAERTGPYLGVQPGVKDSAPGKADVRARGALRLMTWVGFQMQGVGGRVFVQTTEPAVYSLVPSLADEIVLEFTDTRLQSGNDARALETGFFPTAVMSVKASQARNITRVVIKLREVVGYDLRQDGNYLMLDFRPPTITPVAPGNPQTSPGTPPNP